MCCHFPGVPSRQMCRSDTLCCGIEFYDCLKNLNTNAFETQMLNRNSIIDEELGGSGEIDLIFQLCNRCYEVGMKNDLRES